MQADRVFMNARLATMVSGLGVIEPGIVAEKSGRILYAGPPVAVEAPVKVDCEGRWITPGLIDCHTHLLHAGDRAAEFEQRLTGASYAEIAAAGGGIFSTVRATRAARDSVLAAQALPRIGALIAEGVTTVEIKSGYGLSLESELRLLRLLRKLGRIWPVDVAATFLGAHALPPEYAADRAGYVRLICETMLPAIAGEGLADAVDGFCEGIAFSPAEIRRVFQAARAHGMPVKLHADQLGNQGGAALAAAFRALSADHLEYADEAGIAAMRATGTVAVMLPGAFYTLREGPAPPVALFRKHGVPLAVATDLNPGTSPMYSLLLAMNMAATLFRMTVEECLLGVTRHAAMALGRDDIGVLEPGRKCHLAVWNVERPAELVYRIGFNPLHERVWSRE